MKKLFRYIRKILKNSFDNIRNEHLKQNLLQAIPFWIGSVITGLIAVLYAQLFAFGEHILNKILSWHLWMIFIVAPLGICTFLVARKKICAICKRKWDSAGDGGCRTC